VGRGPPPALGEETGDEPLLPEENPVCDYAVARGGGRSGIWWIQLSDVW